MFFSPLGSSRGSRDQSGDVARGDREGGLPLAHVVGELSLRGNLGGPPTQGGSLIAIKSISTVFLTTGQQQLIQGLVQGCCQV